MGDKKHNFALHHFHKPTWCQQCEKFIWGLGKQGYRCKACKYRAHSYCYKEVVTPCVPLVGREGARVLPSLPSFKKDPNTTGINNFNTTDKSLSTFEQSVPLEPEQAPEHRFVPFNPQRPSWCRRCAKLILGVWTQGFRCSICKYEAHEYCLKHIQTPCWPQKEQGGPNTTRPQSRVKMSTIGQLDSDDSREFAMSVMDESRIDFHTSNSLPPTPEEMLANEQDVAFRMKSKMGISSIDRTEYTKTIQRPKKNPEIGSIQLGAKIGKGAFGTVFKGFDKTSNKFVAVKRMLLKNMKEADKKALEIEINLMKTLDHPNVVKYINVIRSEHNINLIMEFVEGGSLVSLLDRFGIIPESLAIIYVYQILQGLDHLHSHAIIHRDIKAANILITKDGAVKLADFGIAMLDSDLNDSSFWMQGSPYWMAREILEGSKPTSASDIWSLGCTIIELMTGSPPYFEMSQMAAIFHMVNDPHPPFPESLLTDELKEFIFLCFKHEPQSRPSAKELLTSVWILPAKEAAIIRLEDAQNYVEKYTEKLSCANPDDEDYTDSENGRESSNDYSYGSPSNNNYGDDDSSAGPTSSSREERSPLQKSGGDMSSNSLPDMDVNVLLAEALDTTCQPSFSSFLKTGLYLGTEFLRVTPKSSPAALQVTCLLHVTGYIWVGCHDGSICVFDSITGQMISQNPRAHSGDINSMVFIPGAQQVITSSSDFLKIWSSLVGRNNKEILRTGQIVIEKGGKGKFINSIMKKKYHCVLKNNIFTFSNSPDSPTPVDRFELNERARVEMEKPLSKHCLYVDTNDGKYWLFHFTSVEEATPWLQDFVRASERNSLQCIRSIDVDVEVNCLALVGEKEVWSGGMDPILRIWDLDRRELIKQIEIDTSNLLKIQNCIVWRVLVVKDYVWAVVHNVIFRFNAKTYEQLDYMNEHTHLVNSLMLVEDGRGVTSVWSCSNDKTIRVWDISGAKVRCISTIEHAERQTSLMHGGNVVWCFGADLKIRVYSLQSLFLLHEMDLSLDALDAMLYTLTWGSWSSRESQLIPVTHLAVQKRLSQQHADLPTSKVFASSFILGREPLRL
eukprot:TRINITY_DN3557_c0_g1_i1.p1 TRINITY_DN3557_c0_g1~~TRINITY_DN3557_c0_g1_i1.p1  ORF type:complete len:1073 (+),score=196.36 TRINITY_DN3557_c0_g1_i1:54-3272(+)